MNTNTQGKDGGPAFPSWVTEDHDGGSVQMLADGMSLRDYFAGESLTEQEYGLVANAYFAATGRAAASPQVLRYFHADAMIAARKAGGAS